MSIDRVTGLNAALTIPERFARERPGQSQQQLALAGPASEPYHPVVPGTTGAMLEAMDEKLLASALAGKLAAEALLGDAVSMQPNQLFASRQLVAHSPEPSALAASWMAMVRTYAEQRAAQFAQSRGRRVPASLFQSEAVAQVVRDGRLPPSMVSELDAWRFAVYASGAEKLVLRVVVRDAEDDGAASRRRRPARVALRLEVHMPDLGKVVLEIEPVDGGVLLAIGAAQAGAMRRVREMLPPIREIMSHCGVRIVRIRLTHELLTAGSRHPTSMEAAMLTPPMFKAMADLAMLMSQAAAPGEQFVELHS